MNVESMTAVNTLVKFLEHEGLLKEDPDERMLSQSGGDILDRLVQRELVDSHQALEEISRHLDISWIQLRGTEIPPAFTIDRFTSALDPKFCWEACIIPLLERDGEIIAAQSNPFDIEARNALGFALSAKVKPALINFRDLRTLLRHFLPTGEVGGEDDALKSAVDESVAASQNFFEQTLETEEVDSAPVARLVNKMLADAAGRDASDVHIEPTSTAVDVRFRIDGVMERVLEVPRNLQLYLTSRIKLLAGMDIAEKRRPQDGRLRISHAGKNIDIRVSSIPVAHGEKIVLRLLRADYESIGFSDLGMPESLNQNISRVLSGTSKLLLVTGPTGSGKTTTLYTALNKLRDGRHNITTVEDPIEYRFKGINQIQVKTSIGVTFASALRSLLRQDPDVIMVGEIRDRETALISLQAAQTGHLVLSTMHTNSAIDAIYRLLDLDIERYAVATTLAGVLAQRLVRKLCPHCQKPMLKEALNTHSTAIEAYALDPSTLYAAEGCEQCYYTGYRGRIGFFSYLEIGAYEAELIQSSASRESLSKEVREQGFLELDEAAVELLKTGVTTIDEISPFLVARPKRPRQSTSHALQTLSESEPIAIKQNGSTQPSTSLSKQTVLLVDDSVSTRNLLRQVLERETFEVIEAANGSHALELLTGQRPAAIICDLDMPEMNGREFLQVLKSRKQTRDIPIAMLTAEKNEDVEADLLTLGADDFIRKFASSKVILARVRRFVGSL